jgi:carboxypeptidase D
MDILTNATILAIQNMTWNGQMGFQSCPSKLIDISLPDLEYAATFKSSGFPPLDAHQGIMGKQHYERGLMFAETYMSGHMEPQFQPRSAYRHLQWVLGRIEEL